MMNSNADVWLLVKLFFKELGLRSTYISHNNLSCQEEGNPTMIGNPVIWFFLWNLVISMKYRQPFFPLTYSTGVRSSFVVRLEWIMLVLETSHESIQYWLFFFFLNNWLSNAAISKETLSSLLEGDCGFRKSLFKNKWKPASVMYFLHVLWSTSWVHRETISCILKPNNRRQVMLEEWHLEACQMCNSGGILRNLHGYFFNHCTL